MTDDGAHADPAWSPDGQRIVFSAPAADGAGHDLVVAAADGAGSQPLGLAEELGGTGAFRASWSPDGDRVAFQTDTGGDLQIYVVPVEGGTPQPFAGDPAARDFHPAWTRDGGVLFTSDRSGREQIWLRTVDGDEQQVTEAEMDLLDADPSPCGDWLAVQITRSPEPRIGTYPLDGSTPVAEVPLPEGVAMGSDPAWAGQACP